jgi:GT2 family glycosyltransferase
MAKSFDIVIVSFNSTEDLIYCLQSIYQNLKTFEARIFVYDNASKDGIDRVRVLFPKVILCKNQKNVGFARAVNMALKHCDKPYVVLLNPDTLVQGDFFEAVLNYMEENREVAILGPRVVNRDGSIQGSARSFPNALTALFGRNSLLTKWFPNNRISRCNVLTGRCDGTTPMEVDWVSGSCMVLRRQPIINVGLFDERFFIYWEDADCCRRMWDSGWKVVYFPRATIIHHVGGSSKTSVLRSVFEFHISSYRLFKKHTRFPLSLARPIAAATLMLRLMFVLLLQLFHRAFASYKASLSHPIEASILQRKEH